jgi:radical SAM enzyme (TIGR01210 family)
MCDLWKNTTETRVPVGAIPGQIDFALSQLPAAQHIKLYNSGNFFDPQAIPRSDFNAIADRVRGFETVIVENHPIFCSQRCVDFRDLIGTQLEIAVGLETIHPDVLPRLNKQMTVEDFETAVKFLLANEIEVRAFVLLKPPFMSEDEGISWAVQSMEFAFSIGVSCCSIIPTRAGNGIMERLEAEDLFAPPTLASMEAAFEYGLNLNRGRVFLDLWDVERFFVCAKCGVQRAERLLKMNLTQQILPRVECDCEP